MSEKDIKRKKEVLPKNTHDLAIEWLFQGRASEKIESHLEETKKQSTGLLFVSRSEPINNRFNYLKKNDSDSKHPIIMKEDDELSDSHIIRLLTSLKDESN